MPDPALPVVVHQPGIYEIWLQILRELQTKSAAEERIVFLLERIAGAVNADLSEPSPPP